MQKPMLAPLQTEGWRPGGQPTVDGTESGLLPVSVNAVSREQSQALSLRCCTWLLPPGARGGERRRAKPAEAKIFTVWPCAREVCQAPLWETASRFAMIITGVTLVGQDDR